MAGAEWLQTGNRGGNQRPSVAQSTTESLRRLRRRGLGAQFSSSIAAPDCGSGVFQAPLAVLRKTGDSSSRRCDLRVDVPQKPGGPFLRRRQI